jgi:alkanesulfonate monooxygenase SsuD/methylene tetrahydromethanopterin reductase-like flavin-dependent oxidoreductase (luciferase family)
VTVRCEVAYDFFSPPASPAPLRAHYTAMLEQAEYADRHGFDAIYFTEHHGVVDNYLPSPLIAAAAVAGRTQRARLRTVLLVPFYDPIKLAEDIAVVDLLSGGRADPVFGAGYVDAEFEMFGKDMRDRRRTVDSTVAFLRRAWTEDDVELDGRRVRVTPKPVQQPHPPITLAGMSGTAARAAARLGDDFLGPEPFRDVYREACVALGKPDPGPGPVHAPFIHVTQEPERDWPLVAPFLLTAIGHYLEWTTRSAPSGRPPSARWEIRSQEELRASRSYRVVTPDECIDLIAALGDDVLVRLQPGWGGYSPELAWSSLELFVTRVLPTLRERKLVAP